MCNKNSNNSSNEVFESKINGKCIEISIKDCSNSSSGNKIRRPYANFNKETFSIERSETKKDILRFLRTPIIKSVKDIVFEMDDVLEVLRIDYDGIEFIYGYRTGEWTTTQTENVYYTTGIQDLMWRYVFYSNSMDIKKSFVEKKRLKALIDSL